MDTVPPFFASNEDAEFVWGRGSCDAKGIIAAMIAAAEKLLAAATRNFGLLFLVGEERNSAGAKAAAANPRGSRFLINGEPTDNRIALGSKGALRFEITARGKLAHSAYPRTWPLRDSHASRCAAGDSANSVAAGRHAGREHAERRHDFRRPRA